MRILIMGPPTSNGYKAIDINKDSCGGGWVENLVNALHETGEIQLFVTCIVNEVSAIQIKVIDKVTYIALPSGSKSLERCTPVLLSALREAVDYVEPDVVHIIGTEREHDYRLAEISGFDKTIISITGLVSICAEHYYGGIDGRYFMIPSLGDFIRHGGPYRERKRFEQWGRYEKELIKGVQHVFGRTTWDYACVKQINPNAHYHFCSEILNPVFLNSTWDMRKIKRHRIFVSQGSYPLKGLHQMIRAFRLILDSYPDAQLVIAGSNIIKCDSIKNRVKSTTYGSYIKKLIKELCISKDRILFTGSLDAKGMRNEYMQCNVFVLPSIIENSSNSLGEAMALGVPCVASCVGGNQDMLRDRMDGYLYPFDEYYMLAYYVCNIFKDDELAASFGNSARNNAKARFDPKRVISTTIETYKRILEQNQAEN